MNAILMLASHILARFGLWPATVAVLSAVRPLSAFDEGAAGRINYAVSKTADDPRTKSIVAKLIRKRLGDSQKMDLLLAALAHRLGRFKLAALIYRRTAKNNRTSSETAAALVMNDLTESLADHSIDGQIAAMIDALALSADRGEPVVLVPVGGKYLDLFELWIDQAQKHISGRFVALTLDRTAKDRLASWPGCAVMDLSAYFLFDKDGVLSPYCRNNLWMLRVLVMRELVTRGNAVISLDLDAIVLRDLGTMLDSFPDADIVAQQDYSIPLEVARELGFVICCGFMVFRPNERTAAFLARYAEQAVLEFDDQLAVNHMIGRAKVANLQRTMSYMSFESAGVSWLCPDKSLVSRDLRYGSVVRHFQQLGETVEELRAVLGVSRDSELTLSLER